jgi:hypothetical protein
METDYREAGMRYDRPGASNGSGGARDHPLMGPGAHELPGQHYQITNIAQAALLPAGERPKILTAAAPAPARAAGRHAGSSASIPR